MADYTGTAAESDFSKNPNPAKQSFSASSKDDQPVYMTRENPDYSCRKKQMTINIASVKGGRDYVNLRLSRHAGECKIDWEGGKRADGSKATGRKEQSHVFPYPRRIADKIDQYVFSKEPQREGVDEAFALDASADGSSLNDLMIEANDYITSCGWCWIGVDAPNMEGVQVSQTEKQAQKIRPYWSVYSPLSVVDWKFDAIGNLVWLITEGAEYASTTPMDAPMCLKKRAIWTAGNVQVIKSAQNDKGEWEIVSNETIATGFAGVPFVLVGETFQGGYSFDDIESVNRSIMDIESVNRANFFRASYPQIVLPESVIRNAADSYNTDSTGAVDLVLGLNYPILLSEGDANPFYLMPDSGALKAPRDEIQALKKNMFDSVGLMLQNESKQVASGESKAWDFLDVEQVMKARAKTLQDAETRAAQITNAYDPSIELWTPVYNTDFDIGDFNQEIQALILASNAPLPKEVNQIISEKILKRVDRIGSEISAEQMTAALEAIREFDPTALSIEPLETL